MIAFLVGIALQVVAVMLVLRRLRQRWITHNGAIFLLGCFVYHGMTEVVQILLPNRNIYRTLVSADAIDAWVLLAGAGMLIFAITYLAILPSEVEEDGAPPPSAPEGRVPLDWRLMLLITAPTYFVAISGDDDTLSYWISGLVLQYLLFAVVLTAYAYLATRSPGYVLPVLLVQSVLVAIVGSRLYVCATAMMLLCTYARYHASLRSRQLFAIALLIVPLLVLISAARSVVGRGTLSSDVVSRVTGFRAGLESFSGRDFDGETVLRDFVYRFDGNVFPAMELAALRDGEPPAGTEPIVNYFLLAIPRAFLPSKLDAGVTNLVDKVYLTVHYQLPRGFDYLPTVFGIILGCFGPIGFVVAASILGASFARIDVWLHRGQTPATLLVSVGLIHCATFIEQGPVVYVLTFRGLLVLYVLLMSLEAARYALARSRARLDVVRARV